MIDAIEIELVQARDNTKVPNAVCGAAHTSLLLLQKYHSLTDMSVRFIAWLSVSDLIMVIRLALKTSICKS